MPSCQSAFLCSYIKMSVIISLDIVTLIFLPILQTIKKGRCYS
nr:MAG TPA_asm: hypothetical protein [Caudoviricetes sp.]